MTRCIFNGDSSSSSSIRTLLSDGKALRAYKSHLSGLKTNNNTNRSRTPTASELINAAMAVLDDDGSNHSTESTVSSVRSIPKTPASSKNTGVSVSKNGDSESNKSNRVWKRPAVLPDEQQLPSMFAAAASMTVRPNNNSKSINAKKNRFAVALLLLRSSPPLRAPPPVPTVALGGRSSPKKGSGGPLSCGCAPPSRR